VCNFLYYTAHISWNIKVKVGNDIVLITKFLLKCTDIVDSQFIIGDS
jgi:hypothetical protein